MKARDEFKKIKCCSDTSFIINPPLPEGWGRTKPGRRKGAPVVRPAGFSSITPYVVRQVTRFTRSFSASFDSSSLVCSSLNTKTEAQTNVQKTHSMFKNHVKWKVEDVPEHEVAEEGVTLTHSEIVQQGLWHITGVLEEARQASKHLHDLKWWQIIGLLHVLNTCGEAFLLCRRRVRGQKWLKREGKMISFPVN